MGLYKIHTMNQGYQNTILRFISFQIRSLKILNVMSYKLYDIIYIK